MIKIIKAFNLFIGGTNPEFKFNQNFATPIKQGNYIIATDGIAAVYTEISNFSGAYSTPKDDLFPKKYLKIKQNTNELLQPFDLDKYKTKKEYRKEEIITDCDTCNASGEVVWPFGEGNKIISCPDCYGDGQLIEIELIPTGEMTFSSSFIQIKKSFFRIDEIYRLFTAARIIGQDIYIYHVQEEKYYHNITFKIGQVKIIIMAVLISDQSAVIKRMNP